MPSLRRARVAVLSAMTAEGSLRPEDVMVRRESLPEQSLPLRQDPSTSPPPPSSPTPALCELPDAVHFSPPSSGTASERAVPAPPPPTPAHVGPVRPTSARLGSARLPSARPVSGRVASGRLGLSRPARGPTAAAAANAALERGIIPRAVRQGSVNITRRRRHGSSPRPVVRKPQPPPHRPSGPRLPLPCQHNRPSPLPRFRGDRARAHRPASVLWAQPGGGGQESTSSSDEEAVVMPEEEAETAVQRVACDEDYRGEQPYAVAMMQAERDRADARASRTAGGGSGGGGGGSGGAGGATPLQAAATGSGEERAICVGGYAPSPLQSRPSSARSDPLLESASICGRRYNHLRYVAPPKSASETHRLYDWRRYAPSCNPREAQDSYDNRSNRDGGLESGIGGDRSLLITRSVNTSAPLMDDAFLAGEYSEAECEAQRGDVSEGDVCSPPPPTPPPAPPPSVATLRFSHPSTDHQSLYPLHHPQRAPNASIATAAPSEASAPGSPAASTRPPPPRSPSAGSGSCPRTHSCSPHTAHTTGCLPTVMAHGDEGGGGGPGGGGGSRPVSRPVSPPSRPGTPRWR